MMTGREFRNLRSDLKLSYDEMGQRLDVHGTTIRAWEKREEVRKMAEYAIRYMMAHLHEITASAAPPDSPAPAD
jgi:DNA-binding transcriptional regulator YiaG